MYLINSLNSEKCTICPNCGEEKPISEFGYRHDKEGKIKPQSWCKECRSKFERYKSMFKDKETIDSGEYINSYYRWDESIEAFPEEYAFISEFNRGRILNVGNGKYRVMFSNKKSDAELVKEYDENERIKLELELIKNPLIVRCSVPSISPDDENLRNAVITA